MAVFKALCERFADHGLCISTLLRLAVPSPCSYLGSALWHCQLQFSKLLLTSRKLLATRMDEEKLARPAPLPGRAAEERRSYSTFTSASGSFEIVVLFNIELHCC
ncbi:hypothetical protein ACJJTC_012356 [Scirpophaga incertulas]